MKKALKIAQQDTVATALEHIAKHEELTIIESDGSVSAVLKAEDRIPFGFKVAIQKIRKHEKVIKYGTEIGVSTSDIEPGHLIHIHNVQSNRIPIPEERIRQMMKDMNIEMLD